MVPADGDVSITVCPNGPLLVRGPARLQVVEGDPVVHDRTVIALCRCGRSAVKPLCDGSHRRGPVPGRRARRRHDRCPADRSFHDRAGLN